MAVEVRGSPIGLVLGVGAAAIAIVVLLFFGDSSSYEDIASFDLEPSGGVKIGPVTVGGGPQKRKDRFGPIELTPEMNPVRVSARLWYYRRSASLHRPSIYTKISSESGETVWEGSATVARPRSKSQRKKDRTVSKHLTVGKFSVPAAGRYYLDVETNDDRARIKSGRVTVSRTKQQSKSD